MVYTYIEVKYYKIYIKKGRIIFMSEVYKTKELNETEIEKISGGAEFDPVFIYDTRMRCNKCYEEKTIPRYVSLDEDIRCSVCGSSMHVIIWYDDQENEFFPD